MNGVNGTHEPERIEFIYPQWSVSPRVHACTTTRAVGNSTGPYAGLNLATHVGDDPARVAANRRQLVAALKLSAEPVWLEQVHGTDVFEIDGQTMARTQMSSSCPSSSSESIRHQRDGRVMAITADQPDPAGVVGAPCADASLTHEPGRVCAVLTADCLAVLLCERHGGAVAAVHAGWRGLLAGVIERTVGRLGQAPERIAAWLGPAIGPRAFEVGPEVREAFVTTDPAAASAFEPSLGGRWLADLYRLARQRLEQVGVSAISGGEFCTFSDQARFYSYRREGRTGRMASLIWLDS
ncbi:MULTISPECIES: peptidoglycan editing factor PgeF [Thiorhodovibrio]|uniref:peptidoglycan editing factor PgeF n=1 Tax=Thiorhodovibrio TaxID=61593 RepID=UPI00191212EF|nr:MULTISPECIES: peptidoglycan editing factor PgeF [Thiorhodovibrio]MBK5970366.1 hypothetical protein [Thiorhodovibrio winogradskyi]WPL10413.1 Laccase domain protein YfiH [Thiorhodovibrio litoralis]